jgi:hypothetical protein
MASKVIYKKENYELPYSMREFNGRELSDLKLVNILQQDNESWTGYQIFIGVLRPDHDDHDNFDVIIIYGTYYQDYPRKDFVYIIVNKYDMIDSDNIVDIGLNSCAILLKSELIIIRTHPNFSSHYERFWDGFDYEGKYLFIKYFTFDSKIVDIRLLHLDEVDITVRKDDISCILILSFTYGCCSTDIEIRISDEEIRIICESSRTEKYKEVHCGHNDFPSYTDVEEITDGRRSEEIYSMEKDESDESDESDEE